MVRAGSFAGVLVICAMPVLTACGNDDMNDTGDRGALPESGRTSETVGTWSSPRATPPLRAPTRTTSPTAAATAAGVIQSPVAVQGQYRKSVTWYGEDGEGYTYRVQVTFSLSRLRKDVSDSAPGEARLLFTMPVRAEVTNTTAGRIAPITAVDVDVLVNRRMRGSCVQEHPSRSACPLFQNEATAKTAARNRAEIGPGQTTVLTARRTELDEGTFREPDVDYVIARLPQAITGFTVSVSTGPSTTGSDGFVAHFDSAGARVDRD